MKDKIIFMLFDVHIFHSDGPTSLKVSEYEFKYPVSINDIETRGNPNEVEKEILQHHKEFPLYDNSFRIDVYFKGEFIPN